MWMQGLQAIFLALSPYEQWEAARGGFSFSTSFASESWLTWFAIVSLTLAVILLLWVYVKRTRAENNLRNNITNLTISASKLQREKAELAATNKKLQRAITELSGKQVAALENMKSR